MSTGTTNFFKLMTTLDEEQLNPLRGDAAIEALPQSVKLAQAFNYLKPGFERIGVDGTEFQSFISSGVKELKQAWVQFIQTQATKVLSADLGKLIEMAENSFEKQSIKTSEVNNIINFVLTYYSVIHKRSINKKEVIEGILMSGIIKKSSFYQKLNNADKESLSVLSWSEEASNRDEIWRHFTLQSCRFIKQALMSIREVVDQYEDMGLQMRLQNLIDKAEYEQFNHLKKNKFSEKLSVLFLFLVGVGSMLLMPMFNETEQTASQNNMANFNHSTTEKAVPVSFRTAFSPNQKPITVSTNIENSQRLQELQRQQHFFSPQDTAVMQK